MNTFVKMSFGDNNYRSTDNREISPFFQESQNDFNRKSKQITKNIEKISKNTSDARLLVDGIGTGNDNQQLRNSWNGIRKDTTDLVQETFTLLRGLSSLPPADNQTEKKQRKIQKERLTDQLTQSLNGFQSLQREAEVKEKKSYQRSRASFASSDGGSFEDRSSGQQQLQGLTDMEQDVDLMILEERSGEIHKLEEDISNINLTFQELGRLVHEQADTITSIEDMVEEAVVQVDEGKKELEQAVIHSNSARKKKLICIIIAVVVVILIIIILAVSIPKS